MTPDLEPLDQDVLALLGEAKEIPELDVATKAKLLGAVEARIAPPTGGGGGGGNEPPSGPTTLLARGAKALAIFAVGTATGIGIAPIVRPVPPHVPVVAARVEPVPSSRPSASPEPVAVIELAPSASAAPPKRSVESGRGLAAERGLLDIARAALARGDASEALASVDRHARNYPDGVLVEEREAMAVKALVALGRRDEAQRRAKRFEERFPNGLMLGAVKGAVGE